MIINQRYYLHLISGPALSGTLVQDIGFKGMMIGIGIISFCYGPLLFILRDPPPRTEQDKQETTVSAKYQEFY